MSETQVMISFLDNPEIVRKIDTLAKLEATNRSAILRRAVRRELFLLPRVPTSEPDSKVEPPADPADVTA